MLLDKLVRGGFTSVDIFKCPYCNGVPLREPMERWWPLHRITGGLVWRMKRETLPWWQVILLEKEVLERK